MPTPASTRMRLTIVDATPIPTTKPTTAPTRRIGAFVVTGSRHVRQAAVTITLLSERPVHIIPISPDTVASQRVVFGWVSAVLICAASDPETPNAPLTLSG